VLILLFGIASIFLMVKARDMFAWIVMRMESEVVRLLPDETDSAQRERLGRAFAAAQTSILDGELDPLDLQDLQLQLARITAVREGKLSPEDVNNLILALEKVGGIPSADSGDPEVPLSVISPQDVGNSISIDLQEFRTGVPLPSTV
jgi:hypothetical protein